MMVFKIWMKFPLQFVSCLKKTCINAGFFVYYTWIYSKCSNNNNNISNKSGNVRQYTVEGKRIDAELRI